MPSRLPAVVAEIATATQELSRGVHGRRRRADIADRKVKALSTMPAAMYSFHDGKLLMGTPGGYFTSR